MEQAAFRTFKKQVIGVLAVGSARYAPSLANGRISRPRTSHSGTDIRITPCPLVQQARCCVPEVKVARVIDNIAADPSLGVASRKCGPFVPGRHVHAHAVQSLG